MEVAKIIEKNNKLRTKLNKINKKYYNDLLLYIRSKTLFKNDFDTESQLLVILQDIIEAQNDGITAEDYFGKNPQETANDLIKEIPNSNKYFINTFSFIFFIFIQSDLFVQIFIECLQLIIDKKPLSSIDLGNILILGGYICTMSCMMLKLMSYIVYSKKSKIINICFIFVAIAVSISGYLIWQFVKTPLQIPINMISIAIIVILMISFILFIFLYKKRKHL